MSTTINVQHDHHQDTPNVVHQASAPQSLPFWQRQHMHMYTMASVTLCVGTGLDVLNPLVCTQVALSPPAHLNSILPRGAHAPRAVTAPMPQGSREQPCSHPTYRG